MSIFVDNLSFQDTKARKEKSFLIVLEFKISSFSNFLKNISEKLFNQSFYAGNEKMMKKMNCN